nr:hypothetical transcript [Hymenolepis microstoma]
MLRIYRISRTAMRKHTSISGKILEDYLHGQSFFSPLTSELFFGKCTQPHSRVSHRRLMSPTCGQKPKLYIDIR